MKYIWYLIKGLIQVSYGIIQTLAGLIVFIVYIDKPHSFYRGNIVTKWDTLSGLSLGLFLFMADDNKIELEQYVGGTKADLEEYSHKILVHEYGHSIQSLLLGPLMIFLGIISFVWGSKKYEHYRIENKLPYTYCFVEKWASYLGEKYSHEAAIW